MLIWSSGRVARIADGLTDKRSPRARTVLPAGMVLWAWDADPEFDEQAGEEWLVLLPKNWNRHVQYAWRFDPCELAPQQAASPPSVFARSAAGSGAAQWHATKSSVSVQHGSLLDASPPGDVTSNDPSSPAAVSQQRSKV